MIKHIRRTIVSLVVVAFIVGTTLYAGNEASLTAVLTWPAGDIAYDLDTDTLSANHQATIALAVVYNNQRSALTGFTLVPRSGESNYMHYQNVSGHNDSIVGRVPGGNPINLVTSDKKAIVLHETLHAMGIQHEHERKNRNQHVTGAPNGRSGTHAKGNGPYDYGSVMHYADGGSMEGSQLFYQRIGLTYTDMYTVGQRHARRDYVPVVHDDYYSFEKNSVNTVTETTVYTEYNLALTHNDGDYDGDTFTVSIVSSPSNGTLVLNNAQGSFDYTPNTDFVGTDSFTYKLNDSTGDSEVATATITVCDSAPLDVPVYFETLKEARSLVYSAEGAVINIEITPVTGATSYEWILPEGTNFTATSLTDSVAVSVELGAHSGYILCFATNADGRSRPFRHYVNSEIDPVIPDVPGTISGLDGVIYSQTGETYSVDSVSGTMDYTWTVPTGATITSGQGTNSITVDFGVTSGQVTVTGSNYYGTSAAQSLDVITVESDESSLVGTMLANDQFQILLTGTPGAHYAIDVSVDLQNWQELTTVFVDGNGTVTYTDIDPLLVRRFYRARLIP